MQALIQVMLSRRTLLKSGTALTAVLIAACNGDSDDASEIVEDEPTVPPEPDETPVEEAAPTPEPTPTPEPEPSPTPTPEPTEPLSYYITAGLDDGHTLVRAVVETLESVAGTHDRELIRPEDPNEAIVQIGDSEEESGDVISMNGEPLIPVVLPDQLISQLHHEDVVAIYAGEVTNWQELGGQDRTIDPIIGDSIIAPDFASERGRHAIEDMLSRASEYPGIISLIPRSMATFHLQSLIVDEIDPIRDELTGENWPWWETLPVSVSNEDEGIHQEIIDALVELSADQHAGRQTLLTIVGDVMLGRTPHRIMYERDDWTAPFPLVTDELQRGDLTIGNLECAITDSFDPPEDPMTFSFMTFTNAVEGLQFAGFHALSGANNHALDFGVVGMQDTTAALESAGIQHFGTGDNLDEARQPCLLEHEGTTFAFLGYDAISMEYAGATAESGGVAPLIQEYVVEDIERTREIADVVIPYFHWGIEYTLTPTENDRRMAHAAVEAGADLVLGGHPHWVQGMEIYQDTAIFYSTSNFVFDQEWSFETKQGLVIHLTFDGAQFIGYRVVPVLIEEFHRPRIVEDDVRTEILDRFWESTSIIADTPLD